MSDERRRAILRVTAPSVCLLLVAIAGLAVNTYWQYVLAISISAAIVGAALAMLVGYARCISLATGAMMAIGAYATAVPVIRLDAPFLAALFFATVLGGIAGIILAGPGAPLLLPHLPLV